MTNNLGYYHGKQPIFRPHHRGSGIYVLRTATGEIAGIVYIGSSDNLERRLSRHFLLGDVPGILFFDWYETSSSENARTIEKQWIVKYSPKSTTITRVDNYLE